MCLPAHSVGPLDSRRPPPLPRHPPRDDDVDDKFLLSVGERRVSRIAWARVPAGQSPWPVAPEATHGFIMWTAAETAAEPRVSSSCINFA